jgi:hypothetical protein
MKRLIITTVATLFLLTLSSAVFAQYASPQQQKDWENYCVAQAASGKAHAGCPTPVPQTPETSGGPSIPIEQIRARNTAAAIQADDEAAKFSIGAAPAATKLQFPVSTAAVSPVPIQTPTIHPYVVETKPETPITPRPVFILPSRRHSAAACGPATPPPGAGWLYGVNRARCLRTAR